MRSLNAKLREIRDAHVPVCERVYHYWRPNLVPPFVVWAEDSESTDFSADNRKTEQTIHGTTDLFTKTEYDPIVDAIQEALEPFGWRLNSVQYEDDTKLIHYEWEWVV